MTWKAKSYIALILAVGFAALVRGLAHWNPGDWPRFVCYLVLAIPGGCLKVSLPGITGTMSVLFVFLLAGIADLSVAETLVIGVASVSAQCFWHAKVRPRAVQVLFGIANISLAIMATDYFYRLPLVVAPFLETPFRLAIAASVFFAANTFPVAAVIALTERKSLRHVWSSCYLWCFPYYLVGAGIVGALSFANRLFDWQAGLLVLPIVYAIYRSYHLYLDQLMAVRKHAEEQRAHAEEVASLHARTMDALAAAMSAKAKLDAVFQASPLAIVTLDREVNVTSWNAMAERILGWSPEETAGRPVPLAAGRSEQLISSIVERTLRGELLSDVEMTQWRKDGTPFEGAIWSAPLRDGEGEISGILITVADLSDRKRLQDQLRLSQKMEAVGRLAGGIAHDFNNLLAVINGYSEILVDSLRNNPYAASQASEILASGDRAAELVSQLLTFSRCQMVKPRVIDVNELVNNVGRMLRRIIGEHIEIRTILDPDCGSIRADLNQMEAVLLNLATNGQDAMPKGGLLLIETARIDVAAGSIAPRPDLNPGSYVRLSVQDTGHGMDAETQQHIFEPFFTTKGKGKGTGLGLSSVYGTIQQCGGRVFVESAVGLGTTFEFYIPRIVATDPSEFEQPGASTPSRGSETILLVEDEHAVRRMLREALNRSGYRVLEAENGAEAISKWGSRIDEIDLVVTDIVMPVLNGLRMAEELRDRRPGLKVLFMSGHCEELINGQAGHDPAPDLLQKPFRSDVLLRKVREVLEQAQCPVTS